MRWQWFLVVEPSSELLTYLRDDNVFGLVPSKTMSPVAEAPSWFTFDPDGVSILQSPHQTLRLMIVSVRAAHQHRSRQGEGLGYDGGHVYPTTLHPAGS